MKSRYREPLDELEALFAEVRKANLGKSPHCYIPRADPHVVKPDTSRLAWDADRFRWLMAQPNPGELLTTMQSEMLTTPDLAMWRQWIDHRLPKDLP